MALSEIKFHMMIMSGCCRSNVRSISNINIFFNVYFFKAVCVWE